jgi:hypothetical protein
VIILRRGGISPAAVIDHVTPQIEVVGQERSEIATYLESEFENCSS